MLFWSRRVNRVIAHDRRGHGRSGQPGQGNDMDTYADDLAAVLDALDVKDAMLVAIPRRGEVTRYIGRHGTGRVSKAVLIGAVPPLMLRRKPTRRLAEGRIRWNPRRRGKPIARSFYKDLGAAVLRLQTAITPRNRRA